MSVTCMPKVSTLSLSYKKMIFLALKLPSPVLCRELLYKLSDMMPIPNVLTLSAPGSCTRYVPNLPVNRLE